MPRPTVATVVQLLRDEGPELGLAFKYDEFAGQCVWLDGERRRDLTDHTLTDIKLRIAGRIGEPAHSTLTEAVIYEAHEHPTHPVRNYLGSLKWDGTPRLDGLLSRYLQVDDSALANICSRKFMIAAVARAYTPGCKVDNILVLEGPRGIGKTSAFRNLASKAWYLEGLDVNVAQKDTFAVIASRWVVELGELSAMQRSTDVAFRNFVTRTSDRYRPAYGRKVINAPRQCVLYATTNDTVYLAEDDRRFWPFRARRKIDLRALKDDRDQLWAEARAAHKAGERWHLSQDQEALMAQHRASRLTVDDWQERIERALSKKSEVSTSELLAALGVPPRPADKRGSDHQQRRVAGIMTSQGWELHDRGAGKQPRRVWRKASQLGTGTPIALVGT